MTKPCRMDFSHPLALSQGELAIRIDENVEETLSNVTGAQAQLMKYLNTVSNNRCVWGGGEVMMEGERESVNWFNLHLLVPHLRWLIMKVFAVLMAFLVLFVVFIA